MNPIAEEIKSIIDDDDILKHYGIKGMKWGVRRTPEQLGHVKKTKKFKEVEKEVAANSSNSYHNIEKTPIDISVVKYRSGIINEKDLEEVSKLANDLYDKAAKAEPEITKDIVEIVSKNGSKMYGLDHRLKQPSSIAGKIGSDSIEKKQSLLDASKNINDLIRYTAILDESEFVSKYFDIDESLASLGYSKIKCKNFFNRYAKGESMHKSVQNVYKNKDGNVFEMQFQTVASQAAKELKLPLYEEVRNSNIDISRVKNIEKQMKDLADQVSNPVGVESITENLKEVKHSMNPIAEEIKCIIDGDNDILMHYGMPRRSGRYPWGSGKDPYQHSIDFLGRIEELKKSGWTETPENIDKEFKMSTTEYRAQKSIATDDRKLYDIARARSLKEDGLGPTEIGKAMGVNESTVRGWLNGDTESRLQKARNAADFIREQINTRGMIDVGNGVEQELNISKENLNKALLILKNEGYPIYSNRFEQVTNRDKWTTQRVICPPGTEWKEIYNLENVHSLNEYITRDGGNTFEKKFHYPESLDSKRLKVLLADDIGTDGRPSKEKDGLVEIRRGVDDLSLGESRYSQVRILVDGDKYIKGMAVYSDNMPDGIDVVFNTSKTDISKALKGIKDDPENPFGSAIKDSEQGGQYWYTDKNTGERKLGLINKRADEGDWTDWKDTLPSQFLSKQSLTLAKQQLNLAKADKYDEYEEIMSITNPTVKKYYLNKFAEECDSAAIDLKAAALPGQKYHAIMPMNFMKENEVYAPNYENGTKLALIRYPHGGTFEIPIVTVNNKNQKAIDMLGNDVPDAIGINHKVAERLSGADFDGDTVMCIPTHDAAGKVKITSTAALKGLLGFDNKAEYGTEERIEADGSKHYYNKYGKEIHVMKNTQIQMGEISNLITDMTLAGADISPDAEEIAAAVRHSMVVIDAEKHKLDWKQSEIDNNIAALKKKYQVGGASTLMSRSKGQQPVDKRQGTPQINIPGKPWYDPNRPEGALLYKTADDLYYPEVKNYDKNTGTKTLITTDGKKISYNVREKADRDKYEPIKVIDEKGNVKYTNRNGDYDYRFKTRTQVSTKMGETDDAYSLISVFNTPMERVYADYANEMKALANKARMDYVEAGRVAYDPKAAKIYKDEVESLNESLRNALLNAPKEREAQRRSNVDVAAKRSIKEANGEKMKGEDLRKASQQAITKNRMSVGAVPRKNRSIFISDKEWEAIQAGAISESQLLKILNNTDVDSLRARATPKQTRTISTAKINRIKAMNNSNYTLAEIAKQIGVSESTVYEYLKGGK